MKNIFKNKAEKNRFRETLKQIEQQNETIILLENFTAGLLSFQINKMNPETVESSYIPRTNVSFQQTIQHTRYEYHKDYLKNPEDLQDLAYTLAERSEAKHSIVNVGGKNQYIYSISINEGKQLEWNEETIKNINKYQKAVKTVLNRFKMLYQKENQ